MNVKKEQRREIQLDAISSLLVAALLLVVASLLVYVSNAGVALPAGALLASHTVRVQLAGFTLLVLLYLWDQRRRLRVEVQRKTEEVDSTVRWLRMSHETACILSATGMENGIGMVLGGIAQGLDADAAAVLGDDVDYTHLRGPAHDAEAQRVLMHVVIEALGRHGIMRIETPGSGGTAFAVPLRCGEQLRRVLCVWRREGEFSPAETDALGLIARTLESALDREEAFAEAQRQIEGTLSVMEYLCRGRRGRYAKHAIAMSDLAADVGKRLGLGGACVKDARIAALFHDIGMLSLPPDIPAEGGPLTHEQRLVVEQHSRVGAEIAAAAGFSAAVQTAIRTHHDRPGTTLVSAGLADQGSTVARIIAACEAYESFAEGTPFGREGTAEALRELSDEANGTADARIVETLAAVLLDGAATPSDPVTQSDVVKMTASPAVSSERLVLAAV